MKNYNYVILEKIREFVEKHPDHSIGAVIYSAMNIKFKHENFTKAGLYQTSNEELYNLLSKALVEADQAKTEDEE